MDYQPQGRTGVSVSQLCLGAMMFGIFGNSDHNDSIQGMTLIQMAIASSPAPGGHLRNNVPCKYGRRFRFANLAQQGSINHRSMYKKGDYYAG